MMYTISDFCRICLKPSKTVRDVFEDLERQKDFLEKLNICVPEVDWKQHESMLLCSNCLEELSKLYEFKTLCIQSNNLYNEYLMKLNGDGRIEGKLSIPLTKKNVARKIEDTCFNVYNKPIHKRAKKTNIPKIQPAYDFSNTLIIGDGNISLTKNIVAKSPTIISKMPVVQKKFHCVTTMPIVVPEKQRFFIQTTGVPPLHMISMNREIQGVVMEQEINVDNLLKETKTEELSVDIDPMDFDLTEESGAMFDAPHKEVRDWEDIIKANEISVFNNQVTEGINNPLAQINGDQTVLQSLLNRKPDSAEDVQFLADHFLSLNEHKRKNIVCEICLQWFDTKAELWHHNRQQHGQSLFKCKYCFSEYTSLEHLEKHMKTHIVDHDNLLANSITLEDLLKNKNTMHDMAKVIEPEPENEYKCEECNRTFCSGKRLSRHSEIFHEQKRVKKFFVKGEKNAKCEICSKEFSTVSYLQIHMKIHYKRGDCQEVKHNNVSIDHDILKLNMICDIDGIVPNVAIQQESQVKEEPA